MRAAYFVLPLLLVLVNAPLQSQDRDRRDQRPQNREALLREAHQVIQRRLKQTLDIPDDQVQPLMAHMGAFADSIRFLFRKEEFIRGELNREVRAAREGTPNQIRISCLMDEFFKVQRTRLDIRAAEQGKLSDLGLTPLQRARFLSLQESIRDQIDVILDQTGGRRGGGAQGARPGDPAAGAQGGRSGRPGGGPPFRGREGQPPPRGLGGPGDRAAIFGTICPGSAGG